MPGPEEKYQGQGSYFYLIELTLSVSESKTRMRPLPFPVKMCFPFLSKDAVIFRSLCKKKKYDKINKSASLLSSRKIKPHHHLKAVTCGFHPDQLILLHASLGILGKHQLFLDGTGPLILEMETCIFDYILLIAHPILQLCCLLRHSVCNAQFLTS